MISCGRGAVGAGGGSGAQERKGTLPIHLKKYAFRDLLLSRATLNMFATPEECSDGWTG